MGIAALLVRRLRRLRRICRLRRHSAAMLALSLSVAPWAAGCQPSQELMTRQLTARMSMIDFSGLAPARPIGGGLEASAAVPRSWELLPPQSGAMFTHRQWRSRGRSIAVGVVHVRLPLPMSAQTLVWLAKGRYGSSEDKSSDQAKEPPGDKPAADKPAGDKPAGDKPSGGGKASHMAGGKGHLLGEWSDAVGREWVEAENDRYHVRGYAVTCGFDAWLVYTGFRRQAMPNPVDLQLAERSMESVVPDPLAPAKGK